MEGHLLNAYLAPVLVPCIMWLGAYRQLRDGNLTGLYAACTLGSALSTLTALLQFHLYRNTRSRRKLTLLMAALMTATFTLALAAFNCLRIHFGSRYGLPEWMKPGPANKLLRYHFYADLVPAFALFLSAQLCSLANHELMCRARRSFVLGEALILSQLASSALLLWALSTYSSLLHAGPFQLSLNSSIVLNLALTVATLLLLPSYLLPSSTPNLALLRYALLGLTLSACYLVAGRLIGSSLDPLTWLVAEIFASQQRISLFCLWLSTVTACLSFSLSWSRLVGRTSSLARKVFHLAVCVIFISGYNQDLEFTRFAVGGVLVVLLLLELVRAWQLKPLGSHLENLCQALRGKWDNKYLTLSHIYLLIGMFIPLWLLPDHSDKLTLSSGLLSLGVGDTAAAVVGTFLGKRRLRGSSKTLEGFVGNIAAMFIFKLVWVGWSRLSAELAFILACTLTASAEAVITTCDNLVLPLVMTLTLQIL